jgi:hypothetical protein
MRTTGLVCATILGTLLVGGGAALAEDRCPPGAIAAGLCAPLHLVDDDWRRQVLGAYERGYQEGRQAERFTPPPPDVALDGKEGYHQSYRVERRYRKDDDYTRRYLDRDDFQRRDRDDYRRRMDRDDYRRRVDRDEYWRRADRDYRRREGRRDYDGYYERSFRRDDAGAAVNMATEILRRALSN